jgi:hypothetical protein
MERDLIGDLGIIMNFNDHTVTWDTDTTPMKDRATLSSVLALIEVVWAQMNQRITNAQQWTFSGDKNLVSEYQHASLEDIIKTESTKNIAPENMNISLKDH